MARIVSLPDPLMDTLKEDPVVLPYMMTDGSLRPSDGHADGGPGGAALRQGDGPARHHAAPAQLVDRSVQPAAAHRGHAGGRSVVPEEEG